MTCQAATCFEQSFAASHLLLIRPDFRIIGLGQEVFPGEGHARLWDRTDADVAFRRERDDEAEQERMHHLFWAAKKSRQYKPGKRPGSIVANRTPGVTFTDVKTKDIGRLRMPPKVTFAKIGCSWR